MPLFFFVSGVLFKEEVGSYKRYVLGKIKTILIPYISFAFLSIILVYIRNETEVDVIHCLNQIIQGRRGKIKINQALWFLPTLFLVENIYFCLVKLLKNKWVRGGICLVAAYFSYPFISEPKLWFGLDGVMYYVLFFMLGNFCFEVINERKQVNVLNIGAGISVMLLLLFTVQPTLYNNIFTYIISSSQIIQVIYAIVMSVLGIWACTGCAIRFEKSERLGFLGRNTLVILGFHLFLLDSAYYLSVSMGMDINQDSNIYSIGITIIILLLLRPLIKICNEYFPEIIGKKR